MVLTTLGFRPTAMIDVVGVLVTKASDLDTQYLTGVTMKFTQYRRPLRRQESTALSHRRQQQRPRKLLIRRQ